jgi:hypothetical protein
MGIKEMKKRGQSRAKTMHEKGYWLQGVAALRGKREDVKMTSIPN